VLNIAYEKMKDCLAEDDLKPLPSGRDIRWANTAQWERLNMVEEGLLRDDSPMGIWEMTEAGRVYLQQACQQSKGKNKL
jgi:restriction system protein